MKLGGFFRKRVVERRHSVRPDPEHECAMEEMRRRIEDKVTQLSKAADEICASSAQIMSALGKSVETQVEQPRLKQARHG